VEKVEPGRLLRLRAEMKMFGPGWLEFEAQPQNDGATRLLQTAFYVPRGLMSFLYWYSLVPFHAFIFSGLMTGSFDKLNQASWARARHSCETRGFEDIDDKY